MLCLDTFVEVIGEVVNEEKRKVFFNSARGSSQLIKSEMEVYQIWSDRLLIGHPLWHTGFSYRLMEIDLGEICKETPSLVSSQLATC